MVLYFDIECERSARRYANEVMEIWAEGGKSNNTKQKEEREEKKRKDRSSETVFEGDAAGENGGD